jgi:hypothetical protein
MCDFKLGGMFVFMNWELLFYTHLVYFLLQACKIYRQFKGELKVSCCYAAMWPSLKVCQNNCLIYKVFKKLLPLKRCLISYKELKINTYEFVNAEPNIDTSKRFLIKSLKISNLTSLKSLTCT